MKLQKMVAPLVFGALSLAVASANAANTGAGITIKNTATLDYKVNTIDQTQVSAENDLLVDANVDLTLERTDGIPSGTGSLINLGGTNYYLVGEFKLKNTGNADAYFTLAAINTADDHSILNMSDTSSAENNAQTANGNSDFVIYLEDGTNTGGLDSDDTLLAGSSDFELLKDHAAEQIIYVAALASSIQGVDDDLFGTDLTASVAAIDYLRSDGTTQDKVAVTGHNATATADSRTFSFVYADNGNDAQATASDVLRAAFPNLGNGDGTNGTDGSGNFTKTSTVISDPINNTGGPGVSPKAIPGAVVEYTITVKNTGSVSAENVIIKDAIPTDTTFVSGSIQWNENGGGANTLTDNGSDDAGDYNVTEAGKVTVNIGTLENGHTDIVKFRVTID